MRAGAALAVLALLAGCASEPVAEHAGPNPMFHDQWFAAPSERISADDLFAMSPEMRQYLAEELVPATEESGDRYVSYGVQLTPSFPSLQRTKPEKVDIRNILYDKLYAAGKLKLEYDATMTRNAAQAFAARSGNCLSLVRVDGGVRQGIGRPGPIPVGVR